jgi:hypothetical protein
MSRPRSTALALALSLAPLACGDAGGERLQLALAAQGSAARRVAINGGRLELSRAEVGLGPLYLCAANSAEAELCEVAIAEWLDAARLDALDEAPIQLGSLTAVSGSVRSAQLDYGISWLLTRSAPEASDAAPGGHSAQLSGVAEGEDGTRIELEAEIDLPPLTRGGSALQLRIEEHRLAAGETLTLRVDPQRWVRRVRFADLAVLDSDGDGHVVLAPGDQAYEAIVQAMSGAGAPAFEWLARDAE